MQRHTQRYRPHATQTHDVETQNTKHTIKKHMTHTQNTDEKTCYTRETGHTKHKTKKPMTQDRHKNTQILHATQRTDTTHNKRIHITRYTAYTHNIHIFTHTARHATKTNGHTRTNNVKRIKRFDNLYANRSA